MIDIQDKTLCCGCAACVQRCPKQCISMCEDGEGFLYPKVDASLCIGCGLCERVCPVLNRFDKREPIKSYAAVNPDDTVREQSASGGIFSSLAQKVIAEGGVVFGAMFDSGWMAVHGHTSSVKGLAAMRGSKYMQSRIGCSYIETERYLKSGRIVLFSGTPCQIAGLKRFLRKEYDNLLTVDVICHAVPSAKIWRLFLDEQLDSVGKCKGDIRSLSFRDKSNGWKNYSLRICFDDRSDIIIPKDRNLFMRAFLSDLIVRPVCTACPARSLSGGSDVTIGDFWGIERTVPDMFDDKGVCALLCNTRKGVTLVDSLGIDKKECGYSQVLQGNPALVATAKDNKNRQMFYECLAKHENVSVSRLLRKYTRISFSRRCRSLLGKAYNWLIH